MRVYLDTKDSYTRTYD